MVAGGIWLATPTRFAGLSSRTARIVLALAALLLLLACYSAIGAPAPKLASDAAGESSHTTDRMLYENIVSDIRYGDNYYTATATELRRGHYPLRPFVTFRLPALAVIQAWLPQWLAPLLLYALVAAVVLAWMVRLRAVFARPLPTAMALLLLAGGLVACVQPLLMVFHEIWAGLLIALSLAARRPGRWIESVSIGLAATLIRETAALYLGLMFLLALADGERREALGWFIAATLLAVVVAFHAHAVAMVVRPLDTPSPGWLGMLGFGFFVKSLASTTALVVVPTAIAALLVTLSLFGWAAWRDPTGLRVLVTLTGYASLIGIFCRADTFYWVMLPAPLMLVGLAFVPYGLRDLIAAALDKRRITVTRVLR
ncbi:MAG: hypothetical protein BGO24_14495 [Sphingomonas sp. 67-36]|uniref:hypothetical protein n=1 Tax=Sphingomonas sp. TaxID=28214 RepID=UPI0009285C78|nr:hypothetical protein [Sphingomonas sp.]MBN8848434.1 hypothetical protein [Sphingomonas sp.]OJV32072.1 MAG: hypothetical protein BGO24_14495 [Sphingomonas sp. 67-36]